MRQADSGGDKLRFPRSDESRKENTMIYWIATLASGALLTAIVVSACILSGRISREEERKEQENDRAGT